MTLHIIGLPHRAWDCDFDGYAVKAHDLAAMFPESRIYAYEPDDVSPVIAWQVNAPHWQRFNAKVIKELNENLEAHDIICLPTGTPMRPVLDAFPYHLVAETQIGYTGVIAPYRVYESYAWQHYLSGRDQRETLFFDDVIPACFDEGPRQIVGDHLLFAGRQVEDKGWYLAEEIAKFSDMELVVPEDFGPTPLSHAQWMAMMASAKALLTPTLYVEPGARVVGEALSCGTPVISTDWGMFTENIEDGVNGFRCHTMAEFMDAARYAGELDRESIRSQFLARTSRDVIKKRYVRYFDRLATLWSDGFYQRTA